MRKNWGRRELTLVLTLSIMGAGLGAQSVQADSSTITADRTGPVYTATKDGTSYAALTIGDAQASPTITGNAYGGLGTAGGSASYFNTAALQNGTVTGSLYGAYDTDAATYNTTTVYAGSVGTNVYGGASTEAGVEHNTVQIGVKVNDGDSVGTISIGGSVYGNASATGGGAAQVTIGQGSGVNTTITGDVYGAYVTNGGSDTNTVTITGGTIGGSVYGSYGTEGWSNTLTLGAADSTTGPSIGGSIYGSYGTSGWTFSNGLTINSGEVKGTVYGSWGSLATQNTLTVNGGTIDQGIYGGYATGFVGNNTITLNGGTVSGDVYAGYSTGDSVDGNTINLYGTNVSGASLYGGGGTGSEFTNNTLNVYTLGNSVANIGNFQNINFYIPEDAKTTKNATMLTVTGTANITNTAIKAGIADLTSYTDGTVITLLTDDNGLIGLKSAAVGTLTDSGFAQTGYYLTKSKDGKSIILTIGTKPTDYVSIVTNGLTSTYPDYDTEYLSNTKGNTVTVTGSTFATNLYGAYASGVETSDNTVAVSVGTVNASVYGAYGGSSGTNNTVTIGAADTDGPTITGNVYAYDGTGITSENTVTVASGSIGGTVYGARSNAVTYNTLTVNGGTIGQGIYGGYATGYVGNNTITLKGGTVSGDVYAGYSTLSR